MKVSPVLAALAFLPSASLLHADQVFLKGGGELDGVVVEKTATKITLEVGPGRVGLPMDRVDHIVSSESPIAEYQRRKSLLAVDDGKGWTELGLYASEHGLQTHAREAFEHALLLDPANPVAQAGVGNVRLGNRWVAPDEAKRAQGYVMLDGRWVTPEEREDSLRQRAMDDADRRARDQARAEEDSREAAREAARQQQAAASAYSGDIPAYFAYYGGYPILRMHHRASRPQSFRSTPVVVPQIVPRPVHVSSRGGRPEAGH